MLMQVSEMSEQDTDRRTGPTWRGMLLPLVTVLASSHFTVPPPSMHCFVHCPLGGLNSLGTVLWFRIASCSRTFFLGPFSVDTKHTLESEWEVLYGNHHFHTMPCALDASRPPHQALNWVTLLSVFWKVDLRNRVHVHYVIYIVTKGNRVLIISSKRLIYWAIMYREFGVTTSKYHNYGSDARLTILAPLPLWRVALIVLPNVWGSSRKVVAPSATYFQNSCVVAKTAQSATQTTVTMSNYAICVICPGK